MQIVTGLGSRAVPGLALTGAGALLCLLLERLPLLQAWSLGALTLAIGLGMVLGHVPWLQGAGATRWAAGVQLAKGPVLRAGIVLYGLRLSVQDITALGWGAVALDVFILSSTVALAWALGATCSSWSRAAPCSLVRAAPFAGRRPCWQRPRWPRRASAMSAWPWPPWWFLARCPCFCTPGWRGCCGRQRRTAAPAMACTWAPPCTRWRRWWWPPVPSGARRHILQ